MGGSERRADDAVEEGLALFQQGKLVQAMERWREAQEFAPGHTRAQEYLEYVASNREALEQRFRLAETQLFSGRKERPTAPLSDVPSKLQLPELDPDEDEDEDEDEEPTVNMPAKVLAQRLAQSRARVGGQDGDYLEVMDGGGQEAVDDFEPMEKTPVGEFIPDPVRLVGTERGEDEGEDGVYEWDEDTPSVREVGMAPLSEDEDRVGLTTGTELNLEDDEEIEELDDADIVEELEDGSLPKEGIEVKYSSLAEFDAAHDEEYLDGDAVAPPADKARLEMEDATEPHFRETLRMEVEPDRGPALTLEPEPEPEEGGMLELMPPDSGEERELELDLGQSVPGPSKLVDLTPQPDRRALSGQDLGEDMVEAAAARGRERDDPTEEDLLVAQEDDVSPGEFSLNGPTPELEMEVQVSVSGQPTPPPPESAPGYRSVDIDMEDSIDMSPGGGEFGEEFGFDDVGEVNDLDAAEEVDDGGFGLADDESFDVSDDEAFDVSDDDAFDVSGDETFDVSGDDEAFDVSGDDEAQDVSDGSVSMDSLDGLSWEEGSIDWSKDTGEKQGLEVLVFERDDPTPAMAVDDPLLAMSTEQDSLDLEDSSGRFYDDSLGDSADDLLAWTSNDETPNAPPVEPEERSLPVATAPAEVAEPTLERARELLKSGELEESLDICEKVCEQFPDDTEASRFLERIQQSLVKRYWADIGDLSHVPAVKVAQHEILWQDMDHRKGFLLSRIDGMLSYGDIIDISGMSEFEACRILVMLKREGVIG